MNGITYDSFLSYNIKYDLFMGSSSFTAEFESMDTPLLFEGPVQFIWTIDGNPVMKGYLDRSDVRYSKGSYSCTVHGRDMMQFLIDNYILSSKPYPESSTKKVSVKLEDIIKDILGSQNNATMDTGFDVNIGVSYTETVNSEGILVKTNLTSPWKLMPGDVSLIVKFSQEAKALLNGSSKNKTSAAYTIKQTRTSPGQTIFDAISSQCNAAGLYLYNVPGTDTIMIHTAQTSGSKPMSYNPDGSVSKAGSYKIVNRGGTRTNSEVCSDNNVISCRFSQDLSGFANFIRLIGQSETDSQPEYTSDGWRNTTQNNYKIEHIISNDINTGYLGLNKILVRPVNSVTGDAWLTKQDSILNNVLMQQYRNMIKLSYTVPYHSQENGGHPYFVNHLADVTDESFGVQKFKNFTFLVYAVEFTSSKSEGQRTNLEMCLPGIYPGWRPAPNTNVGVITSFKEIP